MHTSLDTLVTQYRRLVWSVPRAFRLGHADAADVYQCTWLSLAEHLSRIREPERIAGWLVTTASRHSLRVLELRGREILVDRWEPVSTDPGPEEIVVTTERHLLLWRAFATLDERCRRLLRIAAYAPELSYLQIARAIGMRLSNIGSTRGRCLTALRRRLGAVS
ncbi:sigma-70 family RNA polymerase sigma factor [Lentzea sp. NBRC 105346]|uniref:sigma-70 family RNA polymerase sigma factor n=1 Tax=Lentzea sp. NBRC 105346 TaxID=3032205 RepID=UPI0025566CE0|nr:sigma-70 family RNA polymerase sigma factor [Lentzea sp. NBRC 105346]